MLLVVHHTTLSPPLGLPRAEKQKIIEFVEEVCEAGLKQCPKGLWFHVIRAMALQGFSSCHIATPTSLTRSNPHFTSTLTVLLFFFF
jgi:hypothetical protein